jgi:hypothetical protein
MEDSQQGKLDGIRRGTGSPTLFLTVRHGNARWSVSRQAQLVQNDKRRRSLQERSVVLHLKREGHY